MARRHKKNKFAWVMPAFIVAIMVFSTFAIMLRGNSGVSTFYNGHKIKQLQDGFEIQAGEVKVYTNFHPQELEGISTSSINAFDLMGKQAVLAFDPEQENLQFVDYARFQLGKFLNELGIPAGSAVTKEGNYTLPYIGCENATEKIIVIKFLEGNQTGITKETDSCYLLQASYPQEMVMVEDRFKLTMTGVMNSSLD